jgi:hypothetical protein
VVPSGEFEVLSLVFPEVKDRTGTSVRKKF